MPSTQERLDELERLIARVWQAGDIKLKATAHPDALTTTWAEVDEDGLLWVVANGAAWDAGKVTAYPKLYAALGSPTLPANLPDWKDRFIAAPGTNNGGALSTGGARTVSFTLSQANLPNYTLPDTLAVGIGTLAVGIGTLAISPNPHAHGAIHAHNDGSGGNLGINTGVGQNNSPAVPGAFVDSTSLSVAGAPSLSGSPSQTGSVTSGGSGTSKSVATVPPYLTVGVILLKV